MWHWILYILLFALMLAGLYINLLSAPGLWVMVASAIGYALLTGGRYVALKTIVAVLIMAALAELIEFCAAGAGAKKAGASRRGLWGAIIGGVIGGIFFTIPLFIVGTVLGVCLGTFVGALVGELWGGTEVGTSLRVGLGATKGRLIGMFTKLMFGLAILATVLIAGIPPIHVPWHRRKALPATSARAQATSQSPPVSRNAQRSASYVDSA